ncbi:MAG: gliding motility protein GldM [Flavobacteriaceae bacterium]|jgi:gliding motility-associated protein GldM|nr:gliding motility protein GldM [Flavobacteriaceae bacterium]|tara:strand:- start:1483 stop:3060 length:1578 start_codon:yes stop_codon:yes gene_type:complete
MAGGKVSARQKMINLMYLVFIAMMAMNMSKEVLSAFGLMEAKFAESNATTSESNEALLADLITKGDEKPEEFAVAANKAQQINIISDEFYKFIETLKIDLLKAGNYSIDPKTGKLPFEAMDKTDILDQMWFTGDRLTKVGANVMEKIEKYKTDIREVLGTDVKYKKALESFNNRFNTDKVKRAKDGAKVDWLDYNYKGFPAIASYTKLTALQNDVKVTEASMFNLFLGNTLTEAVTLKNYQAIVLADKSAFFAGEKFQGKVVLGKYANVTPTKLVVQGQEINIASAIDSTGAATLNFNVGNIGEKIINGQFTFLEDGKPLEIPILGNYVVVPRPKEASVAADKMNVLYRGLENPMTISFAGVSDNNVSVSAPGLRKAGAQGKYIINPPSGSQNLIVSVVATLDDGTKVNSKKSFRIKNIPNPVGKIAGKSGSIKLNKRDVTTSRLLADFGDFVYDLNPTVSAFDLTVLGETITVSGNRLNPAAKALINNAPRRSLVIIDNIKVRVKGVSGVEIPPAAAVTIKLTN